MFPDVTEEELEGLRRGLAEPIREAVREMATVDDPAEVERSGFDLAATLAIAPPRIAAELLEMIAAEEHGDRLLHGMAVAASPPVSGLAAAVTGKAQDGGLTPDRAYLLDAGEAVSSLIVTARRPGVDGFQILALLFEQAETGGAVKDGFASSLVGTQELDEMLDSAATGSGVEPREIDPTDAVELVIAGARRCVEHGVGPTEDATLAVNLLVRAAGLPDGEVLLEALPALPAFAAAMPAGEEEDVDAEIGGMLVALEAWCAAGEVPDATAELVVEACAQMAQFRAGYCGGVHTPWTDDDVAEFLLGYVPRKVDVAEGDLDRFPGAVAQVFRFLSDCGRMSARAALGLSARAVDLTAEFAAAAGNPANFGPAKALVTAMARDGVDVGDEAAVNAWIGEWNALPIEERRRLPMALPEPPPDVVHAGRPAAANRTAARKAARRSRRRNRRR